MNNSLFGKMQSVLMSQSDIKDICDTLKRGYYPLAVSGLSSIHKAQLALIISTLSEESAPLLIITDDEAGAKRICDDINEMYAVSQNENETAAYIYPAKDITLARVESVSKEYEYQRLCVLARLIDGSCKIVCASAEAVMQRTIPPDVLADRTIKLSRDTSVQLPDLISRLIAAGYTRCDKVESPSQFSVRGSIADIFPVQEKMPVRMELWDDEIDSFAYFDPETQRRTEQIDELIIPPAGEVLFNSADALVQKINALSAGVRGKRTELVRSNLAKDADNVSNGVSLANIDKYLPLAYDKPALIFDYLKPDSPVLFCEFHSCCEKAKAIQSQFNEDVKILLEEGELCRGLDGYIA